MAVTRQRGGVIGIDRGHKARASLIGMFCDAPDQLNGIERRSDQKLLAPGDVQAGTDGELGVAVEENVMGHGRSYRRGGGRFAIEAIFKSPMERSI